MTPIRGGGWLASSLLRGAAILAIANLVTRLIGVFFRIPLQNIVGAEGLAYYQTAYPLYTLLLGLSTAGIPLAVAHFVAECEARHDSQSADAVFLIGLYVMAALGIFFSLLLYVLAPLYVRASDMEGALRAVRALTPALALVPMMAAFRGYFEGHQQMGTPAVSQIAEQLVRVGIGLAGAAVLLHIAGVARASAAATFGAGAGAMASLGWLLYAFLRDRQQRGPLLLQGKARLSWAKRLLFYAIPISLASLIESLMNNVDTLTVKRLLELRGSSDALATASFAALTGEAWPLVSVVITLASGMAVALLPAVSAAHAVDDKEALGMQLQTATQVTLAISIPAACGLAVLAGPLCTAFYGGDGPLAAKALRLLAFAGILAGLEVTTSAALQGMNLPRLPVRNLAVAFGVKTFGNLLLLPILGLDGAALATLFAYGTGAGFNLRSLRQRTGFPFPLRQGVLLPTAASLIMAAAVWGVLYATAPLSGRFGALMQALLGVLVGGALYLALGLWWRFLPEPLRRRLLRRRGTPASAQSS